MKHFKPRKLPSLLPYGVNRPQTGAGIPLATGHAKNSSIHPGKAKALTSPKPTRRK